MPIRLLAPSDWPLASSGSADPAAGVASPQAAPAMGKAGGPSPSSRSKNVEWGRDTPLASTSSLGVCGESLHPPQAISKQQVLSNRSDRNSVDHDLGREWGAGGRGAHPARHGDRHRRQGGRTDHRGGMPADWKECIDCRGSYPARHSQHAARTDRRVGGHPRWGGGQDFLSEIPGRPDRSCDRHSMRPHTQAYAKIASRTRGNRERGNRILPSSGVCLRTR